MNFVHVAMRTKDLDAALTFYAALDLKTIRSSEQAKLKETHTFIAPPEGNFAIELIYTQGKDDAYEGGERFDHLAFDVLDIEALLPKLTAAGGTVTREPYLLEGTGLKIAFVADPDGNSVELVRR